MSAVPITTITATIPAASGNPIKVSTLGILNIPCPELDGKPEIVELSDKKVSFDLHCKKNYGMGDENDLLAIKVYSYSDCLRACASYNRYTKTEDCVAAVFNRNLSMAKTYNGNCWLKNSLDPMVKTDGSVLSGLP